MTELLVALLFLLTGHLYQPMMVPRPAAKPPAAEWCYYGALQRPGGPPLYLRCPPAHGARRGAPPRAGAK